MLINILTSVLVLYLLKQTNKPVEWKFVKWIQMMEFDDREKDATHEIWYFLKWSVC